MAIQFSNYKLFIDPVEQVVFKNFGDLTQLPQVTFTEGDDARLEIYVVEQTVIPESPIQVKTFPAGTVKVQVGNPGSAEIIGTTSSTALGTPAITADTVGGGLSPFSIGDRAYSGFFKVVIANTSPALSATTRFIQYPINIDDMADAIVEAVNGQSGWSGAVCQVLQTGEQTGTISLTAVNSTTTYTISGTTSNITFTSSLVGLPGKSVVLDFSAAAVGTFLGSETSKTTTLEVQIDDTEVQTYCQIPCVIRAQVEDAP